MNAQNESPDSKSRSKAGAPPPDPTYNGHNPQAGMTPEVIKEMEDTLALL